MELLFLLEGGFPGGGVVTAPTAAAAAAAAAVARWLASCWLMERLLEVLMLVVAVVVVMAAVLLSPPPPPPSMWDVEVVDLVLLEVASLLQVASGALALPAVEEGGTFSLIFHTLSFSAKHASRRIGKGSIH